MTRMFIAGFLITICGACMIAQSWAKGDRWGMATGGLLWLARHRNAQRLMLNQGSATERRK